MSTHPEERKIAAIRFTDMVVVKLSPGTRSALIRVSKKIVASLALQEPKPNE